jgi:hypothetical protein
MRSVMGPAVSLHDGMVAGTAGFQPAHASWLEAGGPAEPLQRKPHKRVA